MQKRFYIHKDGHPKGPYSIDQILEQISKNQINMADYYFDEEKSDWCTLVEHPLLVNTINPREFQTNQGPVENLKCVQSLKSEGVVFNPLEHPETEWFVLKGTNKYGPFKYMELVRMLQEKHLFEYDFVWYAGLEGWQRVADMNCFSPEIIHKVYVQTKGENQDTSVFFRRRHRRVKYETKIIVHNNKRWWRGDVLEVSAGGLGLVIPNAHLNPGDQIFLHFRPGEGVPPFNAICEVVNKMSKKGDEGPQASIRYGLKFLNISQEAHKSLRIFTSRAA